MAILDKKENLYYRVDLSASRVEDGMVYVAFVGYPDRENRDKEKARAADLDRFTRRLYVLSEERAKAFDAWLAGSELAEEEVFDPATGAPRRERFPDAWRLFTEADSFYHDYAEIKRQAYAQSGAERILPRLMTPEAELARLGYDPAWLAAPVVCGHSGTVCCGEHRGEPLTAAFYYDKLKEYYVGETADC